MRKRAFPRSFGGPGSVPAAWAENNKLFHHEGKSHGVFERRTLNSHLRSSALDVGRSAFSPVILLVCWLRPRIHNSRKERKENLAVRPFPLFSTSLRSLRSLRLIFNCPF